MLLRLDSQNTQLCSAVVTCTHALRAPASDSTPFGCYDYLSVYHPEEHTALMELIADVEKGHTIVMRYGVYTCTCTMSCGMTSRQL